MKSRLFTTLLRLLSLLPLSITRGLATLLGHSLWLSGSRMARTTLTNLEICFPDLEVDARRALARNSVIESCKTLLEAGAVWLWPGGRILGAIAAVGGEQLLGDALAQGKGAIIISPHLGNWELTGLWLGDQRPEQTVILYQSPGDAHLDAFLRQARCRTGVALADSDTRGVASLLKTLRQGQIVGILPDQVPPESGGEFVPFFGRPALTMTLVSRLVEKTGCPVLLSYVSRIEGKGRSAFKLEFRQVDARIASSDLVESLTGLNATVEKAILENPALYHWEYKRFRRQPKGMERPY